MYQPRFAVYISLGLTIHTKVHREPEGHKFGHQGLSQRHRQSGDCHLLGARRVVSGSRNLLTDQGI